MPGRQQLPYILAGVVLMTLQPILVTLSQNEKGQLDYSPMSSTFLSEVGKLALSCGLLSASGARDKAKLEAREVAEYSVPAVIYFVNNNLTFLILTHVTATAFQLLSQLKTVFTGLLFRFFLSRHLSFYQYVAIWQLACGTAVSQIPAGGIGETGLMQSSVTGLTMSMVSCALSAFGGIYSEKLLKHKPHDSIHWQNIQLYSWGAVFNLLGLCLSNGVHTLWSGNFFRGFNTWAWIVVLNNALNGLAISAILKYADNIARVYAHASAMLVTMVASIFLFGQSPTPQLIIAVSVVGASAVQYNYTPAGQAPRKPEEEEVEAALKTEPVASTTSPQVLGASSR